MNIFGQYSHRQIYRLYSHQIYSSISVFHFWLDSSYS